MKLPEKPEEGITSEVVSLPPRHTRRIQLRLRPLSGELAAELQHCSVYLLNEKDESVAVRDALVKKGDHCYCVWHCDCVCYGADPRLPCHEMSAARQDAAGLPSRRGARFARACHYVDVKTINIAVVVIGVIATLLALGVLKGLLGLIWTRAGVWGLDWILEEPRPIDRYFECGLRTRKVVYDADGWPVHPDTRKRTVRVVSLPVEFILNIVFFVVTPGLVAVDTLKHMTRGKTCRGAMTVGKDNAEMHKLAKEAINSRHDVQLLPLMHGGQTRPQLDPGLASETNSDEEDTAFVFMRMKKSSDSLARNHIKSETAGAAGTAGTPAYTAGNETPMPKLTCK